MSRPALGRGLDGEEETLNKIKTTVKIAGFLLVVLLALGCGGSMPGSSSSLNPHAVATRNGGGTEATEGAGYRIDGLRGDFTPMAPVALAISSARLTPHSLRTGVGCVKAAAKPLTSAPCRCSKNSSKSVRTVSRRQLRAVS